MVANDILNVGREPAKLVELSELEVEFCNISERPAFVQGLLARTLSRLKK
jgi:hypothetical protein